MNNNFNDTLLPLPLRIEEHDNSCTVYWKLPFHNRAFNIREQSITVYNIHTDTVVLHSVVPSRYDSEKFRTQSGNAYDIAVNVDIEMGRGIQSYFGRLKFLSAYEMRIKKPVEVVSLDVEVNAFHCTIIWPNVLYYERKVRARMTIFKNGKPENIELLPSDQSLPFKCNPGDRFLIELRIYDRYNDTLIAARDLWFRAVYSKLELGELYAKAEQYVKSTAATSFTYFYRCQPKEKFQKCLEFDDGIMRTYVKDEYGHPGSPINSELKGLFFSARLINGKLPSGSPFGDKRFVVRADQIFNHTSHKIYFTDFYCINELHYVTLVICRKGSEADDFASRFLIELNPTENSFFKYRWIQNNIRFYSNMNLWVEFFFTEDIPTHLGYFENVMLKMLNGSFSPYGIVCNKECEICNL